MKPVTAAIALCLCMSSLCFGQITSDDLVITAETKTLLKGADNLEKIGPFLFSRNDGEVSFQKVGVINVDDVTGKLSIKVTDVSGDVVAFEVLDSDSIMIQKSGKYLVFITAIDFEKGDFKQALKSIEFDLGLSPDDPDKPDDPDPIPPTPDDGEFNGLQTKVRKFAVKLPRKSRDTIYSLLVETAQKMRTFEFKQQKQAKDYITRNWPPCVDENCGKLWSSIFEDARGRNLGWSEMQSYYLTVAKGVK